MTLSYPSSEIGDNLPIPKLNATEEVLLQEASRTDHTNFMRGLIEQMHSDNRLKELDYKFELDCITDQEYFELRELSHSLFLEAHPPLNHPFSPSLELNRIAQLPKKDKPPALAQFKIDLEIQRAGLAQCINVLSGDLHYLPDLNSHFLDSIVDLFKEKYGFSDEQVAHFQLGIDVYSSRREKLIRIRSMFPENAQLVGALTGKQFTEEDILGIEVSPLSFDILVSKETYVKATDDSISRGMSSIHYFDEVSGSVAYTMRYEVEPHSLVQNQETILRHERQHVANRLILSLIEFPPGQINTWYKVEKDLFNYCLAEPDEVIKAEAAQYYFYTESQFWLSRAKDEILAQLKGFSAHFRQNVDLAECLKSIMLKDPFLSYDYPKLYALSHPFDQDRIMCEAFEYCRVNDYKSVLEQAINSLAELEDADYNTARKVKGNEFSMYSTTEFVIATLSMESMPDWPKAVRRIIDAQKSLS